MSIDRVFNPAEESDDEAVTGEVLVALNAAALNETLDADDATSAGTLVLRKLPWWSQPDRNSAIQPGPALVP